MLLDQLVGQTSSGGNLGTFRNLKKDDTLRMIQGGVGLINTNSRADNLSFIVENDFVPTLPKISASMI
jgi:hypothetical protein